MGISRPIAAIQPAASVRFRKFSISPNKTLRRLLLEKAAVQDLWQFLTQSSRLE
jgi:hypothetical protein